MGAPSRSRFGKALRRIRDGLQRRLAKVGVRAFAATALFGIGSTFVRGSTWEWVRALGRGTAWAALLALVGAGLVWLGGRRWRRTAPPGEAVREEGGALVFRVGAREVRVPLASIATGAVRSEPLAPGRPELRHLAELRTRDGDHWLVQVDDEGEALELLALAGVPEEARVFRAPRRRGTTFLTSFLAGVLIFPWIFGLWMVSAQLLDSVAAFFALPALGVAAWMRILFAMQPSDVEVGADGLAWREKRQDRFVSFRDLRAITTEGATLLLHTDDGIERIPFGPVDPTLREAVRARVARALARLRPEEAARLEALGRRGRSLAEWKAELQKLFAGGLRSPRVPRVRVIETLDDDGAPPDQRLGAALALVESGDPESARLARRRAAELAEAVADPDLARAFVELADDALQEETAERLADD